MMSSKHIISAGSKPKVDEGSHEQNSVTDDAPMTPSTASSLYEADIDVSTLKDLDEFIGENVRTISRSFTARSGGLTARSCHSACSSRPLAKVLRDIDTIPCDMDDDLQTSAQASALASEAQPRILKTVMSDA